MSPWTGLVVLFLLAACAFLGWRWWAARAALDSVWASNLRLKRELDAATQNVDQSSNRWRALAGAAEDLLITVDADGRVQYTNPAAEACFGVPPSPTPSLIEFTRSYTVDELAMDALHGVPGADLMRVIEIRGRPHRARAVCFEGGAALALTDVAEVQRLGRARRDFIANISHELRTPLTSIRLLLEGVLSAQEAQNGKAHSPEFLAGALRKILVEVESLQQMAQELLDLAQIESGRALLRMVPTPLGPLVEGVIQRLAPQAQRKGQTISVEVQPELVALADPEQVSRALGNLLHNAIKFTPAEGQIWVRASRQGEDLSIEVADSGPGIPVEDRPRVFERFFRGDRSRAGGGTGLGLAIAKHVVEAHGGRIWVTGEGRPGTGATFCFTLPAAEASGESARSE